MPISLQEVKLKSKLVFWFNLLITILKGIIQYYQFG